MTFPSAGDVAKLVEELWLAAISATPGEWKLGRKRVVGWINESDDQSDGMLIPIADVYGENPDADGAWIALASPRNITKLLTALESLSRELAGAREALKPFAKAGELFDQPWSAGLDALIYGPAAGSDYNITSADLRRAALASHRQEKNPHG